MKQNLVKNLIGGALIIGDMQGHADDTADVLHAWGAKVATSDDINDAIHHLRKSKKYDLALIDARLDMRRFLSQLQVERLSVPIVACGAGKNSAERAASHGVVNFLSLPACQEDLAKMLNLPTTKKSKNPPQTETTLLPKGALQDENIIFRSDAMAKLLESAAKFAQSRAHVFICGETGCGKELLAQYIHLKSPRRRHNFVAINCAAIVDNLLESELFGHEKGAFTGAIESRKGKFELADKGTLLLDEISEMDLRLQAKLLRAIQEKCIDRVGGSHPTPVDLRIVATSNLDIGREVAAGRFREDLFYRLNVMPLYIPPLRDRADDIPVLADYFARKFCNEYEIAYKPPTQAALKKLQNYRFPGNVRELENIIHRAVVLADGAPIGDGLITFDSIKIKKAA